MPRIKSAHPRVDLYISVLYLSVCDWYTWGAHNQIIKTHLRVLRSARLLFIVFFEIVVHAVHRMERYKYYDVDITHQVCSTTDFYMWVTDV